MPEQELAALEQEAGESLSLIADLRGTETTTEQTTPVNTETTETPTEQTTTEPADNEADAEARRTALLREIAIDPALTNQYIQQTYQAPQQQVQQQTQVDQAPVLPFDEFSFDPANPAHQQAMLDARLNEVGGPLFQKIDVLAQRFEQEDQQRQAQQMQQAMQQTNEKIVDLLDTYVPGLRSLADKMTKNETTSAKERAVWTEAVNAETYHMQVIAQQIAQQENVPFQQAYNYVSHNGQLRAQISQQIGPYLQDFAKDIGLVSQPKSTLTPEQKQQIKRESYVESSSAVPASAAGNFEKAAKKGDSLSMIAALRAK